MKTDEMSASPAPSGRVFPLSVEAYHALGEAGFLSKNTELLYGVVYRKMPKSPIHEVMIARLMRAFAKLDQRGWWLRSGGPITCVDSEPEPDVSVARGSEEDYTRGHPTTAEFVAEVCVTSYEYDRSKLRAYANAGVKEVWLVVWPEKKVEIYRDPLNGVYTESRVAGPGGSVRSEAFSEITVELTALFRE
jgi:Uma2 family endonuclease